MVGAAPVFVPALQGNGLIPDPEDIAKIITKKTRAILLNTPNNPTGAIYDKKVLEEVAEIAVSNDIIIISDEIYEKLIYEGERHISIASLSPEIKEHTVTINGLSKAYAMTGWRLGYAAGPEDIIQAMGKIQGHTTSNINSITQKAGITALLHNTDYDTMAIEYDKRRKYMANRLNGINGFNCVIPKGAFYTFPCIEGLIGRRFKGAVIKNDLDVVNLLLDAAQVATVPGQAFEAPGFIRLSYANSMDNIKTALDRIDRAVNKLF
jgi:aspartate aminotransferase